VADALPDFQHPEPKIEKITIADMLNHRSALELNTAYGLAG
jgi:CubicO group peptidase (beta-lactamase class C family)